MDCSNIFRQARAAELSGVAQSDSRHRLKQLHGLYNFVQAQGSELIDITQRRSGGDDEDITSSLITFAHELQAHIQNLTLSGGNRGSNRGTPWIDFRPVGLVLFDFSNDLDRPIEKLLAPLAAAFAAGNVVLLASHSEQDEFLQLMRDFAPKYVMPDSLLYATAFADKRPPDFDCRLLISREKSSLTGGKVKSSSLSLQEDCPLIDTSRSHVIIVAAEGINLGSLHVQLELSSKIGFAVIFLHQRDLDSQLNSVFESYKILDIANILQCRSVVESINTARGRTVICYDTIVQVIHVLGVLSDISTWTHFYGHPSSSEAEYLRVSTGCEYFSAGDTIPASLPHYPESLANPDFVPTRYAARLFSRPQLVMETCRLPIGFFENHAVPKKGYLGLIKPMSPDGDGHRLGFFEQVALSVGGISILLAAILGFCCFRSAIG